MLFTAHSRLRSDVKVSGPAGSRRIREALIRAVPGTAAIIRFTCYRWCERIQVQVTRTGAYKSGRDDGQEGNEKLHCRKMMLEMHCEAS